MKTFVKLNGKTLEEDGLGIVEFTNEFKKLDYFIKKDLFEDWIRQLEFEAKIEDNIFHTDLDKKIEQELKDNGIDILR